MRTRAVKIGGRRYKVTEPGPDRRAGGGNLGSVDPGPGVIEVRRGRAEDERADTLLHEVLHAIFQTSGIRVPDEEALVSALTPWLTAFIADNPRVVDEIQEMLK